MVHGGDIIDHLFDVSWLVDSRTVSFVLQDVLKGALRTLNLRAEDSFLTDIHRDKEVGIG